MFKVNFDWESGDGYHAMAEYLCVQLGGNTKVGCLFDWEQVTDECFRKCCHCCKECITSLHIDRL